MKAGRRAAGGSEPGPPPAVRPFGRLDAAVLAALAAEIALLAWLTERFR